MTAKPALYQGEVIHTRLKPVKHRLRYRVFYLLLDLDDIGGGLRTLSHNRFNLFSFHDRDHGPGKDQSLKPWLAATLRHHGFNQPLAKVFILTLPRMLGYVFNPLSIYYCYDAQGGLFALLYEVNNTFGQRHSYLVPIASAQDLHGHEADKAFYVSPFNDVTGAYRFDIVPPGDTLRVNIHHRDQTGPLLFASLNARREKLSDSALLRCLIGLPFLTLRIIAAIHWQALKLWRKGLRIKSRPAPPDEPISLGAATNMGK